MAHTVLIIDDEPDIRLLVEAILQDEGYTIITKNIKILNTKINKITPNILILNNK